MFFHANQNKNQNSLPVTHETVHNGETGVCRGGVGCTPSTPTHSQALYAPLKILSNIFISKVNQNCKNILFLDYSYAQSHARLRMIKVNGGGRTLFVEKCGSPNYFKILTFGAITCFAC